MSLTVNSGPPLKLRLERIVAKPGSGVLVLLTAFTLAMVFISPAFVSLANWMNIADQMVFVLLLALGMTVVLISRGIDLSVGSVMGLSAAVPAFLISQGLILPLALLAGIACGVFCGFLNALMITKLGLPDFIATLAMLGIARGVLFLWTEGTPFTRFMTSGYELIGGQTKFLGFVTVPLVIAIGMCAITWFVLRKTLLGRHFYAIGGNPDAARLSGVPVARVRTYAYLFSGGCAGLAGVLLAGRATNVAPSMGTGYEITAITAAIIGGAALTGGRGRMIGALLGAVTIVLATNAMNIAGVSADWQEVAIGVILVLAVLLNRLTTYFNDRLTKAELQRSHHPAEAPLVPVAT